MCQRTTRMRHGVTCATSLGLACKPMAEAEQSWCRIIGAKRVESLQQGIPSKDGEAMLDNLPLQQELAA